MEEEPVTPQGGSRTRLSVEEPTAAAAPTDPMPPPGSDLSSNSAQLDDAIAAIPASHDTALEEDSTLLGDEEDVFDFDAAGSDDDHRVAILALPAFGRRAVLQEGSVPSVQEEELTDVHDNEVVEAYDMDDSELEGNDEQVRFWDGEITDIVSQALTFLGQPARFASYKGFVGFMRLDTEEAPAPAPGQRHAGAIVVHFRYYRFSKTRGDGDNGVEAPDYGTDVHHVRYLVPFRSIAADPASSLRLAGASLAAEAYPPGRSNNVRLQALWSGLLAAAPVRVPPRSTNLVVTVDVGALRREDRTPELLESMRSALEQKAREADASPPVVSGQEQHLPAPVCSDDSDSSPSGVVAPAAKRKRLDVGVAAEVCTICREVMMLEHGLAEWPRCSHVFHGKCLEKLLVRAHNRCPMCRSKLLITGGMFDVD